MGWLDKFFGPRAATPAALGMRPSVAGVEHAFAIEWTVLAPAATGEWADLHVVLTDVSLGESDFQALATGVAAGARNVKLALFMPEGLSPYRLPPAVSLLVTVVARNLPGQPMARLLEDLAIFTGGRLLAGELGYGLPKSSLSAAITKGRLIAPGIAWDEVAQADLGRAKKIQTPAGGLEVISSHGASAEIAGRARLLQRAWAACTDAGEKAGIRARLRRFGAEPHPTLPAAMPMPGAGQETGWFPFRLASPYFVNNAETQEGVMENGRVLLLDSVITDFAVLVPTLELAAREGFPLAVVAPRITGSALAGLVVNKLRGVVQCAALCPWDESSRDTPAWQAFAALTRTSPATPMQAANPSLAALGQFSFLKATSNHCLCAG